MATTLLKLTFADMYDGVAADLHETDDATVLTQIKRWINLEYLWVMGLGRAYWQEKAGTITLAEGTTGSLYDTASDCGQVIDRSMRISTTGHEGRVFHKGYDKITAVDPDLSRTGKPQFWSGLKDQVFLWPKCNSTYDGDTITYLYWIQVVKLENGTDKTILPPEFDPILELGALLRGMRRKEFTIEDKQEVRDQRDFLLKGLYKRNKIVSGKRPGSSLAFWRGL